MIRRNLFIAGAALLFITQSRAQDIPPGLGDALTEPGFVVEALTFDSRDSGKSRIDLFIKVDYEGLSFVKEDDSYAASYEVSASLEDSAGVQVTEQTWTERITGLSYDQTIAGGAAKVSQRSFSVVPGRYTLAVQIRDNDTKKARKVARTFIVPTYKKPGISMSGIMLLSRVIDQGGTKRIVPSVSANMGLVDNPFHIFCEVYDNGKPDSVRLTATVFDQRDVEQVTSDTVQRLDSGRNELFLTVDKSNLVMGDYRLDVVASNPGRTAVYSQTSRPFVIRWRGMPLGVNSLEIAIEQLKYIARDAEYDSLMDAKTTADRQRAFLAFWKKRDPNPNTPRNERMEEYYRRVEYANKHFTHYRPGWKSDMGLVYIILGPPSYVDRHPFDMNSKPYEVWTYYDINQSMIFVDETGFGDYRLVTPISEVYRYSQWR